MCTMHTRKQSMHKTILTKPLLLLNTIVTNRNDSYRLNLRERQAREQRQPDEQGLLPIHRALQDPDVSLGTVQLMIFDSPESSIARDNEGFVPLHYACRIGQLDVVKFLLDFDEGSYKEFTVRGDLPLHITLITS